MLGSISHYRQTACQHHALRAAGTPCTWAVGGRKYGARLRSVSDLAARYREHARLVAVFLYGYVCVKC